MSENGLIIKRRKMELKSVVFNAARDGKLYRLKVFLDHRPKNEVKKLVSASTNGATPLIMACKNGHLDVAVYLIKKCHADIEQVGDVTFKKETVKGAPPLWCAAAFGRLHLVKCLIRYKASVNSTTKENSTPLRVACFGGHFKTVKYLIEHGADIEIANCHHHTSLMIACYKGHYEISKYLVQCGADINRKTLQRSTALHDCAESGNLDSLKLLLLNGAISVDDSRGITPLLTAAMTCHASIVEYFVQEFYCSKREKVDALELLGATFLDKKQNMGRALEYWRLAMRFRYEDEHRRYEKPKACSPIASFVDATEVQTLSQLNDLIHDPDEMRRQALLVRERILGPRHPDTVYYIGNSRGATYAYNSNFEKCMQCWMHALDAWQKVQEPLSPMTQRCLFAFAELFSHIMSKTFLFDREYPNVAFRDIFGVFERALKGIETAFEVSQKQHQDLNCTSKLHSTLIVAMRLVGLMCKLQPRLNKSEELELKKAVYKLVDLNPRARNGRTPLHLACFKESSSLSHCRGFRFPSPEVVNLLLEVGASPNALDSGHNTPLHLAAMNKPAARAIFNSLLNHGAHLDLCNHEKQTPLQLLENTPLLDVYPLHHMNLQCLSAKAVQTHKIPYKGRVSKQLEEFLDAH